MKTIFYFLLLFIIPLKIYSQINSNHFPKPKGIYNSYFEFMSNSPSETDIYIDSINSEKGEWEGYYFKTPRLINSNKNIKSIWGFSDGKEAYIRSHNDFFKIFIEDDSLCFYGFGIPDMSGAGAVGVAGGAIGGAIYGAAATANARKKKHKYYVDPMTGNIFQSNKSLEEHKFEKENTELIIYRMSKGESIEPVVFDINEVKYNFIPNSYLELKIPYSYKPAIINYIDSEGNSKSIAIQLEENDPVYVLCEYKEKTDQITFNVVKLETGKFDSFKPQKALKKRDKTL
jgi:hypothetical protein